MRVKVEFSCDDDAMVNDPNEVEHVLERVREKVMATMSELNNFEQLPEASRPLMDSNGNSIGYVLVRR